MSNWTLYLILGGAFSLAIWAGLSLTVNRASGAEPSLQTDQKQPLEVNTIAAVLDAIQQELLGEGLCNGGESIDIYMRRSKSNQHIIETVYEVDEVLHVWREAYLRPQGMVVLASELAWKDVDTRHWIHRVRPDEIAQLSCYPVQIKARLADALSDKERAAYAQIKSLKEEWLQQP